MSAPPERLEPVAMTYPKEVAQGHREANGEGGGAQVVSTALIGGGKDAEHQLQGQEKLHSDGLASCCVVVELKTEEGRWENSEYSPHTGSVFLPTCSHGYRAASRLGARTPGLTSHLSRNE